MLRRSASPWPKSSHGEALDRAAPLAPRGSPQTVEDLALVLSRTAGRTRRPPWTAGSSPPIRAKARAHEQLGLDRDPPRHGGGAAGQMKAGGGGQSGCRFAWNNLGVALYPARAVTTPGSTPGSGQMPTRPQHLGHLWHLGNQEAEQGHNQQGAGDDRCRFANRSRAGLWRPGGEGRQVPSPRSGPAPEPDKKAKTPPWGGAPESGGYSIA